MRDTILFDLDGTLLPFEMDDFIDIYFTEMGKHFADMIDGRLLTKYIWSATNKTIEDLSDRTNEDKFMGYFSEYIDEDELAEYQKRFDDFYEGSYDKVKNSVNHEPIIKKTIEILKEKGYKLVIATNPIFPRRAIEKRIEWAGLDIDDFVYVSSYELNSYCKPNLAFYEEVLDSIEKEGKECYMIGNDVQEDIVSRELGLETFLIEDYILDEGEPAWESHHRGSYDDFYKFAKGLKAINQ